MFSETRAIEGKVIKRKIIGGLGWVEREVEDWTEVRRKAKP